MKKILFILIFNALIPITVLATGDGPDFWKVQKVRSNDLLSMHEKPNRESKKIGAIPHNGTCLKNLECVGGLTLDELIERSEAEQKKILKKRPRWCKVQYKKTIGWVPGKYLKESHDPGCYGQ